MQLGQDAAASGRRSPGVNPGHDNSKAHALPSEPTQQNINEIRQSISGTSEGCHRDLGPGFGHCS